MSSSAQENPIHEAFMSKSSGNTWQSLIDTPRYITAFGYNPAFLFTTIVDLFAIALAGVAADRMEVTFLGGQASQPIFFGISAGVAILFAMASYILRSRSLSYFFTSQIQWRHVLITWVGTFLVLAGLIFGWGLNDPELRTSILLFFFFGILGLLANHSLLTPWLCKAIEAGKIGRHPLVIAATEEVQAKTFTAPWPDMPGTHAPVFLLQDTELSELSLLSVDSPLIKQVIEASRDSRIDRILLCLPWRYEHQIANLVACLRVVPLPIYLLPDQNIVKIMGGNSVSLVKELQRAPLSMTEQLLKRGMDLVLASCLILLFAPIILVAAILIKLDSPGPIFYRQQRNGFNDREFKIVKLRSMHVSEEDEDIRQVTREDNRVTRIGRWIRRTSIDELPQLFNVLKGDMSLVGPRPHATAHNDQYSALISAYVYRHHVKPGITGWAQLHGFRGETTALELMESRVGHDIWYINNWSLWLDLQILAKTAVVVAWQRTAY
jgi:undecaprenyl-phosphate galactose phosphotransferase/putative colanic acid biosynthesis UDP-glucose lipid carrier transferase